AFAFKQADRAQPCPVCRKKGLSESIFYNEKKKFGDLGKRWTAVVLSKPLPISDNLAAARLRWQVSPAQP
ncbi:hypothetical protein ACOTIX_22095, partial [Achromobacter xylosoxidans]